MNIQINTLYRENVKLIVYKPFKNSLIFSLLFAAHHAYSGSASLYSESSVVAIGNYAAGIAAEGSDASIGWYNPAGLVLIDKEQTVLGAIGGFSILDITGTSTFSSPGLPSYTQDFSNLSGARQAFIPSFHYALPLGERAAFGLSFVGPFGLATDWSQGSPVRYGATYSELITANVSPELGAKITNNFSIGAGLDLQYARLKFNQMIGIPTLLPVLGYAPDAMDSLVYNKAHSRGVGFHAGLMAMFNDNHRRLGLNYQSSMTHNFNGFSTLSGPLATPGLILTNPASVNAALNANGSFRNDGLTTNQLELPGIVTLSGYQDINEKFAFLGSVVYTHWSSFKTLAFNSVSAAGAVVLPGDPPVIPVGQALVNSSIPVNYRNTWRVATGGNYRINEKLMLRAGGGYDQTPIRDQYRDIRVPDGDRWALSIGAHYQAKPNLGIDIGYTHLFIPGSPKINNSLNLGAGSTYNINANAKLAVDLVGLQAVWYIDQPLVVEKMKS